MWTWHFHCQSNFCQKFTVLPKHCSCSTTGGTYPSMPFSNYAGKRMSFAFPPPHHCTSWYASKNQKVSNYIIKTHKISDISICTSLWWAVTLFHMTHVGSFQKLHSDISFMNSLRNNVTNNLRNRNCVSGADNLVSFCATLQICELWQFQQYQAYALCCFKEIFSNASKSWFLLFVSICFSKAFLSICFLFILLKTFTLY